MTRTLVIVMGCSMVVPWDEGRRRPTPISPCVSRTMNTPRTSERSKPLTFPEMTKNEGIAWQVRPRRPRLSRDLAAG